MKITNTSAVRRRIEGVGYVEPGETITVSETIGLQLRKSRDFREERPKTDASKKTARTPYTGKSTAASTERPPTVDKAAEPATGGDEQ